MAKYEIYQNNKVQPLTVVEATNVILDTYAEVLEFCNGKAENVASFNWKNISGFKKLEEK